MHRSAEARGIKRLREIGQYKKELSLALRDARSAGIHTDEAYLSAKAWERRPIDEFFSKPDLTNLKLAHEALAGSAHHLMTSQLIGTGLHTLTARGANRLRKRYSRAKEKSDEHVRYLSEAVTDISGTLHIDLESLRKRLEEVEI